MGARFSKFLAYAKIFFAGFSGGFVASVIAMPIIWAAISLISLGGWWLAPLTVPLMVPVFYSAVIVIRAVADWITAHILIRLS